MAEEFPTIDTPFVYSMKDHPDGLLAGYGYAVKMVYRYGLQINSRRMSDPARIMAEKMLPMIDAAVDLMVASGQVDYLRRDFLDIVHAKDAARAGAMISVMDDVLFISSAEG